MSIYDSVTITTLVAVDPETAFDVFTREIATWWKPKVQGVFRAGGSGVLRFENGPGGRLVETPSDGAGEPFEIGRILVWEPGRRLIFEWRQGGFAPHEATEVEVRFAPEGRGTRVTLEHRGWDGLPPDHAARHELTGEAFVSMIGLRWADLLVAFRRQSAITANDPALRASN